MTRSSLVAPASPPGLYRTARIGRQSGIPGPDPVVVHRPGGTAAARFFAAIDLPCREFLLPPFVVTMLASRAQAPAALLAPFRREER